MKASSATSAKATEAQRPTGRSSARRPSRTSAKEFALAGPSADLDPLTHAFRKDLADIALAGKVVASHYAEPVARTVAAAGPLRAGPAGDSDIIGTAGAGDRFELVDDSRGWAWGYWGEEGIVGYLPSASLTSAA